VEKPLALDENSAGMLVDAAAKSGKVCSVGQCLRFWPAYTEVKKILDSGRYGRVRHAEFARYSAPPGWAVEGWLTDNPRSGDAALDLHIHDVDMILHLFGKPQSVRSVGADDGGGYFSHISTVYRYPDLSVVSTGGWGMASSYPFNMRALYVLEKATIEMDISREVPVMVYPDGDEGYPLKLPEGDGYRHELIDFIGRCQSGTPSETVSPAAAAESVRVTLREIESARLGKEITVD
jgi:predicted dehydrogenase